MVENIEKCRRHGVRGNDVFTLYVNVHKLECHRPVKNFRIIPQAVWLIRIKHTYTFPQINIRYIKQSQFLVKRLVLKINFYFIIAVVQIVFGLEKLLKMVYRNSRGAFEIPFLALELNSKLSFRINNEWSRL